jgi:phosphoribosylformimino-5-aminoimidazole carboxamide ribotide isomerase
MLIPSIDLMGGRVVQLVQGERLALSYDDAAPWIERFSHFPLVQLIDLDAARGEGDNRDLVAEIAAILPVQVGGGVRTIAHARSLLAFGARRVILGSALFNAGATTASEAVNTSLAESFATAIGSAHIVAAIDSRDDRVLIHGWRTALPLSPAEAIAALAPHCRAFLYTNVASEGTLRGFPLDRARELRALTAHPLIVAGGIRSHQEIAALDALNIDAVVGMAVYTGLLPL